ncbi:MAG: hypothetical protein JO353_13175, partial [Phycisphaerae bacterium]|nr:hypothetical protein [Phycisphaerae bacterium]
MHLVVFENNEFASLAPFSFFRPTCLLRCGVTTLLDKQIRYLVPSRLTLWVRPELAEICRRLIGPSLSIPVAINEIGRA